MNFYLQLPGLTYFVFVLVWLSSRFTLWPLLDGALHYHVLVLCAIKCNIS